MTSRGARTSGARNSFFLMTSFYLLKFSLEGGPHSHISTGESCLLSRVEKTQVPGFTMVTVVILMSSRSSWEMGLWPCLGRAILSMSMLTYRQTCLNCRWGCSLCKGPWTIRREMTQHCVHIHPLFFASLLWM